MLPVGKNIIPCLVISAAEITLDVPRLFHWHSRECIGDEPLIRSPDSVPSLSALEAAFRNRDVEPPMSKEAERFSNVLLRKVEISGVESFIAQRESNHHPH